MHLQRLALTLSVTFLLITAPLPVAAQRKRARPAPAPAPTLIQERDIRAQLGFLASDALQGRGSGTNFERLAAEYIGSQFRSFGLEPGGDADASGNKDFVQRVMIESTKFSAPPSFTVTAGTNTQTWQFGRDFLVSFLRATKITGDIQVIDATGTPTKGAVVVIKSLDDLQKRQQTVMKAYEAGAAAVALLESENNRRTRESGNARLPSVPPRIGDDADADRPFAVINLTKQALDALVAMGDGAKAEFSGQTEAADARSTWNAVGILRGSDPKAAGQVIVLSAHLDHIGVNEAATGDKIFNGADDNASGCVAVLEMARVLASGKRPRRTIYFVCFGSEEQGGYGSRYFIAKSPVPLTDIVANVNFEMLGRPDAKVPPATLWLTGFDRSNLGPTLGQQGASIVADPHPEQNFFQRSDNYTLALKGVVAHTISSYGMHTDYHRVSDDISKIDFPFMTRSLNSLVAPIRWLANSNFRPEWLPGKAPTR